VWAGAAKPLRVRRPVAVLRILSSDCDIPKPSRAIDWVVAPQKDYAEIAYRYPQPAQRGRIDRARREIDPLE